MVCLTSMSDFSTGTFLFLAVVGSAFAMGDDAARFRPSMSCQADAERSSGAAAAAACFGTDQIAASLGSSSTASIRHYEYVFPDESICVYDEDEGFSPVKAIALPRVRGIRGVAASPTDGMLYISYGGDGAQHGTGALLKFDLSTDTVVWTREYRTGIDSMAISPTGERIYMPIGELSRSGVWMVIETGGGSVIGKIKGGAGPHNTIVSFDGARVYLGGRFSKYLFVADARTYRVIKRIGPLADTLRPFTISGTEGVAYTTATHLLGFQVVDLSARRVLYTVKGFGPQFSYDPETFPASAPSHGISLSPDERELYVLDSPNSYVHVFDVRGVPGAPPRQVADIKLSSMAGSEEGCLYDCVRDGWVQHSRDGRFVFVGDAGNVINTASRKIAANLVALRNSRKHLEINWQNGRPLSTSSRTGLGYVER
jgi:DNA-binding beta-propeller fold protein YncE